MNQRTPSGHRRRYIAVAAVFCVVCLVYIGRMFYVQIIARKNYLGDAGKYTTEYRVIQAVRGEIYDRNGVKLVGNHYTYRFVLDYASLPRGKANENDVLLSVLGAMEQYGTPYKSDSPFEGVYPDLSVKDGAGDKVASLIGIAKLKDGAGAAELIEYLKKTYLLDEKLYSPEEMTRLLTVRCDLLLASFGDRSAQFTLSEDVDSRFIGYISELNLSGVTFASEVDRTYLYPGYASHILGRISQIYKEDWDYYAERGYSMNSLVGVSGCELAFEEYLHGQDGKVELKFDKDGNLVERNVITEPVAGKDIYLTIDINLQIAAEDGLAENAEYIRNLSTAYENCNSGALTALDPSSGEVLAIASYPTYDLSRFNEMYDTLSSDAYKPLLNRATSEIYAPGSTFKLGVAAAALTEGIVSGDSVNLCSGRYTYYSDYQPKCWVYPGSHGDTNVVKAIRVSCNCFFYEVGRLLGIERIVDYCTSFGLGQKTGIEIGEVTGTLASPDEYPIHHKDENGNPIQWTPGLTIQAAIGQCDNSFTPLQIANYVSTLLNGGTRYAVHLLGSVRTFEGEILFENKPVVAGKASITAESVALVREGMREAVWGNDTATVGNETSTGNSFIRRQMKNLPVTVGAKTGTAQRGTGIDNALLVCAAPYDTPDIVICCVLEKGASGQYASIAAARVLEAFYGVGEK